MHIINESGDVLGTIPNDNTGYYKVQEQHACTCSTPEAI